MRQATRAAPESSASTADSFGDWLRQRRKALGLTHAALADSAHCSVSALRKIEQDERRPSYRLAERLAACLHIPDDERGRFLEIARGDLRVEQLAKVSAVELPALPATGVAASGETAADAARPLIRLLAPFDSTMPSIAVLPFVNLSDDAANEHFADGLAEELLNVLAKVPGLRVVSRTSAFSFKGKEIDMPTLAQKLNVASVLEGSVRRAGKRVRIVAQLIQAASDSHLWSQSYDRDLDDIFAVQDDIAQSVVRELRAALLGEAPDAAANARVEGEVLAATRGRTDNAQAHQLYLRGRFLIDRVTPDDTTTAIGYYRQALQLDPQYALAWSGLAGAHSSQAGYGWTALAETVELARAAAERALELEPDLAEAHTELGWIRMNFDRDWPGAEASYRRALESGSGDRSIVSAASVLADCLGRKDDAVALARRAAVLDPLSAIAHGNLGLRCINAGLLDEAEAALGKAIELNPRGGLIHGAIGTLRLEQRRAEEALAAFQREEIEAIRLRGLAMAQHARARHAESQAALQELIEKYADDSAFQIAEVFAHRGDADRAFEWLERAYLQRDPGLNSMQSYPSLRNLYGDPRWPPFLHRMGFAAVGDEPAAV